jgi:hypothetical protein
MPCTRKLTLTYSAGAGAQTECGARVAVCEGDKMGFGVKFIKGEKGKLKAFKKGGCLGTSAFIGKPYNKSAEAIDLAWPQDMPQARPHACADLLHAVC